MKNTPLLWGIPNDKCKEDSPLEKEFQDKNKNQK